MTLRGLSTLLLITAALALAGLSLASVLVTRLLELRAEADAVVQDCDCCQALEGAAR
jgi:hypothetical protein